MKKLAFVLMMQLSFYSISFAAQKGTPTIVTNDVSSPVVVTGNLNTKTNIYKPIGVTSQVLPSDASMVKKSAACATEIIGSKICTSEELIYYPTTVSVGVDGVWIMPVIKAMDSSYNFIDITGISLRPGSNYNLYYADNDVKVTSGVTSQKSVLCCSPQ